MLLWENDEQKKIEEIIIRGSNSAATQKQIIQIEIGEWRKSEQRDWMIVGERYYRTKSDILDQQRMAIGESGAKEPVANLADNRLANGFIKKLVDQKTGYLLGKPFTIQTKNKKYLDELKAIFNKDSHRRLKSTGKKAINNGIAWWFVYYDESGKLSFKLMNSLEIIPLWADTDHTVLDAIIRDYEVVIYEGLQRKTVRKIEWWDAKGVQRYVYDGADLTPDVEVADVGSHFNIVSDDGKKEPWSWGRVPFIWWKFNEEEQPLVEIVKSLVDDYDRKKSNNSNNIDDLPESVYVIKGYGGEEPGKIRKNLSIYRIIKIDNPDEHTGIETISLEIDTEAYKTYMEQARKDIYEFGRGVDTQSTDFGSAPSGIALRFLYSDLDLDASLMETEFQASLEQLRWFIDTHLYNTTKVDYSSENVEFIFNRDMPIDEESIITGIKDSVGILSKETLVAQHPYVTDVQAELQRKNKDDEEELTKFDDYNFPRGQADEHDGGGEEE